jgi:hypothetical protein
LIQPDARIGFNASEGGSGFGAIGAIVQHHPLVIRAHVLAEHALGKLVQLCRIGVPDRRKEAEQTWRFDRRIIDLPPLQSVTAVDVVFANGPRTKRRMQRRLAGHLGQTAGSNQRGAALNQEQPSH